MKGLGCADPSYKKLQEFLWSQQRVLMADPINTSLFTF